MERHTRQALAVAMTLLLTVALVAPAMGQTGPYEPEEPPTEEPPAEEPPTEEPPAEEPPAEEPPAEEPEVEGVVEVREEPAEEADVDAEDDAVDEVAEVREVTLVRTGADTFLLVVAGLLALGLGGLMLLRSRRRDIPGA